MKLNRKGIWFSYEKDLLCRYWPWYRSSKVATYYSSKHDCEFYSLRDYLKFVGFTGSHKSKSVMGFTYQEILTQWIKMRFSNEIIVMLTNIDATKKPSSFWENVPYAKRGLFTTDVVVLICKDVSQAKILVDSVHVDFADAVCVRDGQVVYWNSDTNDYS